MKPSEIHKVLDTAKLINDAGGRYYPLFIGPPGIGKSENVQTWAKNNGYELLDLRLAYLEAPDLVGLPDIYKDATETSRVRFATPDFWPSTGNHLIFLDELNRGNSQVLNTVMQMLTDKKVHKHELPSNVIFVGAINPETSDYDVNTLDPALKNRFSPYNVEYSQKDFVEYMKQNKWNEVVVAFVESNTWKYKTPETTQTGVRASSPRNLAVLNKALSVNINKEDEFLIYEGILGEDVARVFYAFKNNESPVYYKDLIGKNKKTALRKLSEYCNPEEYKSSMVSITCSSMIENHQELDDDLLVEVCMIITPDQAVSMLQKLSIIKRDSNFAVEIMKKNKTLADRLKLAHAGALGVNK